MPETRKPPRLQPRDQVTLDFERPLTTVDLAVFAVRDEKLQVLLVRRPDAPDEPYPDQWALPGGFVDIARDTSLQDCAKRKLLEKTGVRSPYLEQVGSWGNATRDPRGWSATHVYFALIREPAIDESSGAHWHIVNPVSPASLRRRLAFDHRTLLQAALQRLTDKVEYTSLPAFLLPEPFTLPQLQRTYEVVLGRAVDKSAFRTRVLAADFLRECGLMKVQAPRPAMGYKIADRNQLAYFPRTFSPRD